MPHGLSLMHVGLSMSEWPNNQDRGVRCHGKLRGQVEPHLVRGSISVPARMKRATQSLRLLCI